MKSGTYIEPFFGSGAVFFRYAPEDAFISDANSDLIECYTMIRDHHCEVEQSLRVLAATDPDISYYNIRASQPTTAIDRAARLIYLNRTCWNGLYRVNQMGKFNVPRGTKTRVLLETDNFAGASALLKKATIAACDFEVAIDKAREGDVIFADPPYTVAHNANGFIKYNQKIFTWQDQIRLAAALIRASQRDVIVVSTNADHPDVKALYVEFETSSLSRSSVIAGLTKGRKSTTELLVTNVAGMGI